LTTVIVILFNYFSQRHFSFRSNKTAQGPEQARA
jgi:hypothetical protein